MKLGVSHLAPDAFFGLIKRALPSVLRLSSEQCIDYFLLLFCSFELLDSDELVCMNTSSSPLKSA